MKTLKLPTQTKPVLWGVAAGAAAMAFIGFTWGGWVTGGSAESAAQLRISDAVVVALAPVCAERFRRMGDAAVQLVELKKADPWSQGEFVEKGGWASVPGTNPPEQVAAVAKACAEMLASAETAPKQ